MSAEEGLVQRPRVYADTDGTAGLGDDEQGRNPRAVFDDWCDDPEFGFALVTRAVNKYPNI